jgi:hypothetical protein
LSDPIVVLLSADTGMLEHPILIERTDQAPRKKQRGQKQETAKNKIGVRVQSMLNPELRPGRLFQVQSSQTVSELAQLSKDRVWIDKADGVYVADTVRYRGNNFTASQGPFYVEVEGDLL